VTTRVSPCVSALRLQLRASSIVFTTMLRTFLFIFAVLAATPHAADACLWDYDTLKEEALGQAEVLQVLGGDLHKHSTAFYEAKVTYTRAIIDAGKAPKERYDDLAVALAKTGKLDAAIAVLADKAKLFPGEYTTEANLGTFLAMKGDLTGALDHLKKAIAINPDAHFGRETYQIQLLEFAQRLAKDKTLGDRENFLGIEQSWDGKIQAIDTPAKKRKLKVPTPPVAAIVGLIRFGDAQDSPQVWSALGWALIEQGDLQLAARAFHRAHVLGLTELPIHAQLLAFSKTWGDHDPMDDAANKTMWARLVKTADAEWTKGQAADAARQQAEDAKLAKKQFKAVFGY
jgi:tetratricopeptide (TPR) repeat protein